MSRLLSCTLCLVFLISAQSFSQQKWVSFTGKDRSAPRVEIVSSAQSNVSFIIQIDGMSVTEREINISKYQDVYLPESGLMKKEGLPQLPIITKLVAIPDCDDVSLSITPGRGIDFSNYNIIPAPKHKKENLSDGNHTIKDIYEEDNSLYSTNSYFPGKYGEILETGYVRGQKVARIAVYPVQFNPVSRKVKAYTDFKINMSFTNPVSPINKELGIFRNMMNHAAINYELKGIGASTRKEEVNQSGILGKTNGISSQNSLNSVVTRVTDLNTLVGTNAIPVDYLIITHSSLFNSSSLTTLANFRRDHNGFDVAIVKVEDIYNLLKPDGITYKYPSTSTTRYISVRDFIKDVYLAKKANHTYDGYLGYVLLAGDAYLDDNNTEMVPSNRFYTDLEEGGDYYYACTGGDNDDLMDLMYGRLSVGNETQLSNCVNKIISYENNSNNSWCTDNTFVCGSPDKFLLYDNYVLDMINIVHPSRKASYAFRKFNDDDLSGSVVQADYLKGFSFTLAEKNDINSNCYTYDLESWLLDDANGGLNNRVHTFVYGGHGGWNALCANEGYGRYIFMPSTLESSRLHNDLYSFMILNCCDAGHFDNNLTGPQTADCIGEQVVYLANKGAIGCLASTRDSYMDRIDVAVFEAMYQGMSHVMGEAVMESKLNMDPERKHQYNLYGDPAVNLWPTGFTMTENTTLSGKIQISENLTVPSGVTLTISPGANLIFSNGASISVNGNLVANGTPTNKITFQRSDSLGRWGNITFDGTYVTGSTLSNVNMSNGNEVRIMNGAKVTVSNCTLKNFYHGIYIYNTAPQIDGNQIINPQQNGIYGEASALSPVITNNTITKTNHSGQGIYLLNGTNAYVAHNDISGCDYGIYIGSARAYFNDGSLSMVYPNNRFTENNKALCAAWGGYISGGSSGYNSGYNSIHRSIYYDVYAYQSGILYAQNNFWEGYNPMVFTDGTSTVSVSNMLADDPWTVPYGRSMAAGTDNSVEIKNSLSKTTATETDPVDLTAGVKLEKEGRLVDAISWYKSLVNSDKYQSFAMSELMRIKNM